MIAILQTIVTISVRLIKRLWISLILREDLLDLLSTQFLTPDGNINPQFNVSVILKIKGHLSPTLLEERVEKKFVFGERRLFRKHLSNKRGELTWVSDANISIQSHFHFQTLNNEHVKEWIVAQHQNQFAAFENSPWEFCVVHLAEDDTLIIFRFHHILGDGFSLFGALRECLDDIGTKLPQPSTNISFTHMLTKGSFLKKKNNNVTTCDGSLIPEIYPTPSYFKTEPLEFKWIRELAKNNNVSCTAVILSTIAAAANEFKMPNLTKLPIVISLPRSRPSLKTLENNMSAGFMEIDLHRANEIQEIGRDLQGAAEEGWIASLFGPWVLLAGGSSLIKRFLGGSAKQKVVLSLFPGPQKAVSILKHEVKEMDYFFSANDFSPLNLCVFTYNGKITVWLSSFSSKEFINEFGNCLESKLRNLNA